MTKTEKETLLNGLKNDEAKMSLMTNSFPRKTGSKIMTRDNKKSRSETPLKMADSA